jgi:predicted CxxxxCH...CXXCH cytochrome family protein
MLPDAMLPDAMLPDAMRPDAMRPDAMRPDAMIPDAMLPDAMRPDAMRPDAMLPDAMLPDAMRADAMRPDAMRADAMRPDALLPDAMRPDAMRPDGLLPDAMLPDAMLPDAMLPDAMPPDAAVVVVACNLCHGGADGPAPPQGLAGEVATNTLAVGAHEAHLMGGLIRGAIECAECHLVPDDVGAVGHMDTALPAELTFGALASAGAMAPSWDRATATCGNTWCHGGGLTGGSLTGPIWTTVDGTQASCGTCHGSPPPAPHAQLAQCSLCHPRTVGADGALDLAGGHHIDGVVDFGP